MRILIVGAGATGGYFGGRLAQAGRDVTFLVRPARAEHLRRDGLRILSPHGEVRLEPRLATASGLTAPFDLVLLAVKAYSLEAAIQDMAGAVGPDTVILPLLNGMKHLETLAARFGESAVIGGLCRIASTVDDQGRIHQLSRLHDFVFGERDGSDTPRIRALDAELQGAGFDARWSREIEREMWEKWVMLASLGGATCLMRGSIGEIEAAPGGTAFVLGLLDEVVAVAHAVGQRPSADYLADIRAMLTARGSAMTASMYRDLTQGGQVEAEQILGDLLARGSGAGVATPLLALACTHLAVYQGRLNRERPSRG